MKIKDNIYYLGVSDSKKDLFEEIYPLTNGANYNSYLIKDNKTVLVDTCDIEYKEVFLNNLKNALGDSDLDYLVIEHLEPDHAGLILEVSKCYPNVTLILNKISEKMLVNYYPNVTENRLIVNNDDVLNIGKGNLKFLFASQVHWPEVMLCYYDYAKTLFSADAFGSFGAYPIDAAITDEYVDELIRYYANIVGKFGKFVLACLAKLTNYEIELVLPLHGVMVKKDDLPYLLDIYTKLASYESLNNNTLIVVASCYGNTLKACEILKEQVPNSKLMHLNRVDLSYVISEMFKYKKIVLACITYYSGIFPKMEHLITDMKNMNISNKDIYLIENGSWGKLASKKMNDLLANTNNNVYISEVSIDASVKDKDLESIEKLSSLLRG